jgi:hypothetical protein
MTEYLTQMGHWGAFFLLVVIAGIVIVPFHLAYLNRKLRSLSPQQDVKRECSQMLLYGIVFTISYVELLAFGLLHYDRVYSDLTGLVVWTIANFLLVGIAIERIEKKGVYDSEPIRIGLYSSLVATLLFTVFIILGRWSALNFTACTLFPLTLLAVNRDAVAKDIGQLRRWVNREKSQ